MRVYIPATLNDLRGTNLSVRTIHYVSPKLREREGEEDEEVLEAYAFYAAADAALVRLASEVASQAALPEPAPHQDPLVRVVVSAELDPSFVAALDATPGCPGAVEHASTAEYASAAEHPSAGKLTRACPWESVVAIHCDERQTEPLIEQALAGDDTALSALAEADLLWYDASERALLLAEFSH